jgi:hypothetical protein
MNPSLKEVTTSIGAFLLFLFDLCDKIRPKIERWGVDGNQQPTSKQHLRFSLLAKERSPELRQADSSTA